MNKLIKSAMVMACVGTMLCIVGCGGASNDPGEIAADFFNAALDGKDMQAYVKKYATDDAVQRMNSDVKAFTDAFAAMKEIRKQMASEFPWFDNLKVKFVAKDVKIDGDKAKVALGIHISGTNKLTKKDSEEVKKFDEVELKKVDGVWKLGM